MFRYVKVPLRWCKDSQIGLLMVDRTRQQAPPPVRQFRTHCDGVDYCKIDGQMCNEMLDGCEWNRWNR